MKQHITQSLIAIIGEGHVKTDESLKNHTAIKIGGNASWYVIVQTIDELKNIVAVARENNLPVVMLGSGTSMVPPDDGIQGIVIRNNCRGIRIVSENKQTGDALIAAESGVLTNQLVRFSIEKELSGLEYAMGLPGTIGGAIVMNAMYPKKEVFVSEFLDHAYILTSDGIEKKVNQEYFQFAINTSILQETKEILLVAVFRLKRDEKHVIDEKSKEALMYRIHTQPKGHTTGYTYRNIGGFEEFVHAGVFVRRDDTKNVWYYPDNPRYILHNGSGKVEDLKELSKQMTHFLQTQHAKSEYTIMMTGEK